MSRVLLLSFGTTGHEKAAHAVQAALHQVDPTVDTFHVDPLQCIHPLASRLTHEAYLALVEHAPFLWNAVYDRETLASGLLYFQKVLSENRSDRFDRVIDQLRPDAVVCTQAYSFLAVARSIKDRGSDVPVFGIITDFHPHRFWVADTGFYIVPTPAAALRLISFGVRSDRIHILGMPVHPAFVRQSGNSEPATCAPRVLIMGGTHGLGVTQRLLMAVDSCTVDFAVDVVTGLNSNRERELLSQRHLLKHHVTVHGFVSDMPSLMRQSSVLISKAGGLTCAEALITGLPMVITRPLLGQEMANALELETQGVALGGPLGNIPAILKRILIDEALRVSMRTRARKMARADAAIRIAHQVLSAATHRNSLLTAAPTRTCLPPYA